MYKRLKLWRVIISVTFLVLLTLTILDVEFGVTALGRLLVETQLVPAILVGAAGWIVLWVLLTLSFGRIYCSTVCPMGTLQDAAAWLGVKSKPTSKKRYQYHPSVNAKRLPIPIIVGVCLFLGFSIVVEYTDPFYIYSRMVYVFMHVFSIAIGSIFAALIVLFGVSGVAFMRGRLICNTICPIGGLLGLLSRNPIYRVDINTDKCIHCGKCEDVCKSECINLHTCVVDNTRCVMCQNCTAICPNDAIVVRRGKYKLATPLMRRAMQCEGGHDGKTSHISATKSN